MSESLTGRFLCTPPATAFLHPWSILIPHDVPKTYDATKPLKPDSWTKNHITTLADAEDSIKLPTAGSKGMWNWLQLYLTTTTTQTDDKGAAVETQ
ncbi:hypothetical protein GJ744_009148 [Endocarpon pusillum]|uniref:Uncharacterized protein n=1 Tax=Endocarpon pusillum TaxID=364733 RepID=A0A8H7E2Y8_9EURO|nr:hypothetical protein GJ744_009148 [Endocarpon pusillum]